MGSSDEDGVDDAGRFNSAGFDSVRFESAEFAPPEFACNGATSAIGPARVSGGSCLGGVLAGFTLRLVRVPCGGAAGGRIVCDF